MTKYLSLIKEDHSRLFIGVPLICGVIWFIILPNTSMFVGQPLLLPVLLLVGIIILLSLAHNNIGLSIFVLMFSSLFSKFELGGGAFSLSTLFLYAIFLSWVIKMLVGGKLVIKKDPILLPWFFLILASLCSMSNSSSLMLSIVFLIQQIFWLIIYLVVTNCVKDKSSVITLVYALIFASLIIAVIALYEFSVQGVAAGLIESTMGNKNGLGGFMVAAIPITIGLLREHKKVMSKIFLAIILTILSFVLILTLSRMSWFAMFVGFLVLIRSPKIKIGIILGVVIIKLFFPDIMYNILYPVRIFNPEMYQITKSYGKTGGTTERSDTLRFALYETTFSIIQTHPILGIGGGNFRERMEEETKLWKTFGYVPQSHNTYLGLLTEIGLFGFLSFLGILFIFFYEVLSAFKLVCRKMNECSNLFLGMIASIVGILTWCLFHDGMNTSFHWFLFALTVAFANILKKEIDGVKHGHSY